MQHDRRGLPLTTTSAAAAKALDDAILSLLGHRADVASHVARALAADPGMVAALCLAGFGRLLLARSEMVGEARRLAEAARRSLAERGATARERLLVRALRAGCDGEMEESAGLLESALEVEPLDAMVFKLAYATRFMLGDGVAMRLGAERVLPAWIPGTPERGFVLGCYAFALEESGDLVHAERIGREAMALGPDDLWACHAVAHVLHTGGRIGEGIVWLADHEPRFIDAGAFAAHLFWHRALLHLAQREVEAALEVYDRQVRPSAGVDYRAFANAASLLWRLERAEVATGDRWHDLAALVRDRVGDHALVFAQLHHMLAFAGAGRWEPAVAMLASMDLHAREGWGTQARVLRDVGIDMAKAIFALSIGDPQRALELLLPLRKDWRRVGGSEAQRSIFRSLLVDAVRACGREEEILRDRASARLPNDSAIAREIKNSRAA
jgi:hypothetical protein